MFPVWHELRRLDRGQINVAGIRRRQGTWKYLSEKIALLLHRHVDVPGSLVVT